MNPEYDGVLDKVEQKECEHKYRGETLKFNIDGQIHTLTAPINGNIILAHITVYNPTRPIVENGQEFLMGRKESLECEYDSETVLFKYNKESDVWELEENGPHLSMLQDPFYCGEFTEKGEDGNDHTFKIVGGVKILEGDELGNVTNFRTEFYRYENSIHELRGDRAFAVGPAKMKDVRLLQLPNNDIVVTVRPQDPHGKLEGFGGRGKIGFTIIKSLNELSSSLADYAKNKDDSTLFHGLFGEGEWGGANELHFLANGKIGVLCHVARIVNGVKNYEAAAFVFDPETGERTPLEILATADDFEPITPKTVSHGKIIYSGGLIRNNDGTAWLYVGIGDVKAGRILISDPFLKYES